MCLAELALSYCIALVTKKRVLFNGLCYLLFDIFSFVSGEVLTRGALDRVLQVSINQGLTTNYFTLEIDLGRPTCELNFTQDWQNEPSQAVTH